MMILGLEFSSPMRSVALLDLESNAAPSVVRSPLNEDPRTTFAFRLIQDVLALQKTTQGAITHLALGLGPGSYTGTRAGISIAQGWEAGTKVKIVGIPSVEVLAHQASELGWKEPLTLVFDAQRGEAYAAGYRRVGSAYVESHPLQRVEIPELQARLQRGERVAGPDLARLLPSATALYPDAGVLVMLAKGRTEFVAGDSLKPIYLRETQFVKVKPICGSALFPKENI